MNGVLNSSRYPFISFELLSGWPSSFKLKQMQSYTLTNLLVTLEYGPSKGWSGVHLLHDNASSHKCELKSFLASEKVEVLNNPPYSPDLSPCDFFLFPRHKKMFSGSKYTSRSSLGSAIYQCLQQIPKEDYLSAFRDWVKRLQKCVSGMGEYFEGS